MTRHLRALVVASRAPLGDAVAEWLIADGYEARVVPEFAGARDVLDREPPDLLVTELKLGEYNGLHLVIRARGRGVGAPAIVVGEEDSVLQDEALGAHASYVTLPLDRSAFLREARALRSQQPHPTAPEA